MVGSSINGVRPSETSLNLSLSLEPTGAGVRPREACVFRAVREGKSAEAFGLLKTVS